MTLNDLHKTVSVMPDTQPMPVLFFGHGSPMNAIEQNEFSDTWIHIAQSLPLPVAVVCVSAHWETRGTRVTANQSPKTIHDFYGFPKELYHQQYPAPGFPLLAQEIVDTVKHTAIENSHEWGLDHGTWSVLKYVYPKADIPVIQISMDHFKDARWHYELGKELAFLRSKGVLVVGSGNMVHNLRMVKIPQGDFNAEYGYDWAFELNEILKQKITANDHQSLIRYNALHKDASLAVPTPEHYIPMLYTLAMKSENENIKLFNDKVIAGSLSMTSFIIG